MKTSAPTALFFHGLNTFGDDLLHIGRVSRGRMDRHLREEFESRGVRFFSMNGIGMGSPEDQALICARQIETLDIESETAVHFLGNSMGGLVARALAALWKDGKVQNPKNLRVASLISWGTPHRGTVAADFALDFTKRNSRLVKSLAQIGYDMARNDETYRHYSPRSLDDFNRRYPLHSASPEHSFICAVPLREVSPYFWALYGYLHGVGPIELLRRLGQRFDSFAPSDGFIPVGSQNWGERHGPYALDHFAQSGFFSILSKPIRARAEFEKLCDDMTALMKTMAAN